MSRKFLISMIVLGILLLGAAALFVQSQRPGTGAAADRLQLVARSIARGEDQVHVPDLARRIIEDRRDFVLIDLRPAAEFEAEHIPGARSMTLAEVLDPDTTRSVARGRTLILYDAGATEAAQAAALLRVAGIDAQSLRGGFNFWLRYTLDPESELEGYADMPGPAERAAVACYFHGDYLPTAGIPVQPAAAAYTPPLSPVPPAAAAPAAAAQADPLGLGLGLGVGTVAPAAPAAPAPAADPLGLGLGLGVGTVAPPAAPAAPAAGADPLGLGLGLGVGVGVTPPATAPAAAPAPAAPPARRPGLRVGEGC
jgi:rhodanese-related sulfurtransferase